MKKGFWLLCLALILGCGKSTPSLEKAMVAYHSGNFPMAYAECQKAIREDGNNIQAHRFLIWTMERMNRLDEAFETYQTMGKNEPQNPVAHFGLGFVYFLKKDYHKAIEHFEKALQLNPKIEYVNFCLGWIYSFGPEELNDKEKGVMAWTKEVSNSPDSIGAMVAHYRLGEYYRNQLLFDEAESHWKSFVTLASQYKPYQGDVKMVKAFLANLEALRLEGMKIKSTLAENPKNEEALFNFGILHYKNGQKDLAIEQWGKVVEINPKNYEAINLIGKTLLEKGKTKEAVEQFNKVLGIKEDFPLAHFNLAVCYVNEGRYQEAIAEYKKYLELEPYALDAEEIRKTIEGLESSLASSTKGS